MIIDTDNGKTINTHDSDRDQLSTYVVSWEIEIDATSPEDAARQALAIQRDRASLATVFMITTEGSEATRVDLSEEGDDPA